MKKLLLVLMLALVLAIAAIVPAFAAKKGLGEESTTGSVTKPEEVAEADIACMPKQQAEQLLAGTVPGQDGPIDRLPSPNDPVPAEIEEAWETEDAGLQPEEEAETPTFGEALETAISDSDAPQDIKDKAHNQLDKAYKNDEIPVCAGEKKSKAEEAGVQPGETLIDLPDSPDYGKIITEDGDLRDPGSDPKKKDDSLLGAVADFFDVDPAYANHTQHCDSGSQPTVMVAYGTSMNMTNLQSVRQAISDQLWYQFSVDHSRCTWVNQVTTDPYSIGSAYPIYMVSYSQYPDGNGVPYHAGPQHFYKPSPYAPYTLTPWAEIPDNTTWSQYGMDSWSTSISHEALETVAHPYAGFYAGWNTAGPASYVGLTGTAYYWWEVSDPIWAKESGYRINGWNVSNYFLPSWLYPGSAPPWDAKAKHVPGAPNTVPGPLQMDPVYPGGIMFNWEYDNGYANDVGWCHDPGKPCTWPG